MLNTLPLHASLLHPLTGEPLRAVGIINGRTIWPIMGGSEESDDANEGASGEGESDDAKAASEEVDYKAKFEAQQKVSRDLEKKVKGEAGTLKTQLDALQAKLDGKEAEHAAAQEKAASDKAIIDKANGKILRSEVKTAAKGVLADPADAYKFLDLDSFEVSEDGEVDDAAIEAALKALVEKKPYLAVQDGKRFQGGADGGTRKESNKSVDEQIAAAEKAGDIQTAIALKQKRSADLRAKS